MARIEYCIYYSIEGECGRRKNIYRHESVFLEELALLKSLNKTHTIFTAYSYYINTLKVKHCYYSDIPSLLTSIVFVRD